MTNSSAEWLRPDLTTCSVFFADRMAKPVWQLIWTTRNSSRASPCSPGSLAKIGMACKRWRPSRRIFLMPFSSPFFPLDTIKYQRMVHSVILLRTSEIHSEHSLQVVERVWAHWRCNLIFVFTINITMENHRNLDLGNLAENILSVVVVQLESKGLNILARCLCIRLLNFIYVINSCAVYQSNWACSCRYNKHCRASKPKIHFRTGFPAGWGFTIQFEKGTQTDFRLNLRKCLEILR